MMKRIAFCMVAFVAIAYVHSADLPARTSVETGLFSDYQRKHKIGTIGANEVVSIIEREKAHAEDADYWRFDVQLHDASIRVHYKNMKGYVSFYDLKSTNDYRAKMLHKFTDKVLVPLSYCETLYHLNTKYIETTDPFILNYEKGIKHFFTDDLHPQWYFNYPTNYSFGNDLYFQFGAVPGRYFLNGFIIDLTAQTFTCVIDANYDLFGLYAEIPKYEVGKKYQFNYVIDGDYIVVSDGKTKLFNGVFVEKTTWQYIYYYINRHKEAFKYQEWFSETNSRKIIWPTHSDGSCEYD